MRIAAKVAKDKEAHPERYCPAHRCLWRTNGGYCPRHGGTVTTPTGITIKGASCATP